MSTQRERDEMRERFLVQLYDMTSGRRLERLNYRNVGAALGISEDDAEDAAVWLVDHGVAEWTAMGGQMAITTRGIDIVEQARREEDDDPVATGTDVLTVIELRQVESFLHDLAHALESGALHIGTEERAELEAQKATVEAQMRSPRPSKQIIGRALRVVGRLLEGAGGNALFEAGKQLVEQFLA